MTLKSWCSRSLCAQCVTVVQYNSIAWHELMIFILLIINVFLFQTKTNTKKNTKLTTNAKLRQKQF